MGGGRFDFGIAETVRANPNQLRLTVCSVLEINTKFVLVNVNKNTARNYVMFSIFLVVECFSNGFLGLKLLQNG